MSSMTSLLNVVQYFLGTPFLLILVPLLVKYWADCYTIKNKLEGKVVLITGASSGLGEAIAHELYRRGCKLILAARRLDQLNRVKTDLLALRCKVETFNPEVVQLDVCSVESDPDAVRRLLKIHGSVDLLINNAGVSFRGSVSQTDIQVHRRIMDVNYFAQIALVKALLPSMIERKSGHIVMVNSVQGKIGIPFRSVYAASKHALQAYSDSLRAEVADSGVKVTVASPGYINTALSLNALTATGSVYAKMDEGTAGGYSSEYVAKKIVSMVMYDEKEAVIAPLAPRVAILIRTLLPSLYFFIMQRRANKGI